MKSKTLLRARGHAVAIVAYRNCRAEATLQAASLAFRYGLDADALALAHESGQWRNLTLSGRIGRDLNYEATTN